jgi:hypothetical protein
MAEEAKTRSEAIDRAAQCRVRAAEYDSLADEAKQRGDIEMSIEFAKSATEERIEALRIEEGISKLGE